MNYSEEFCTQFMCFCDRVSEADAVYCMENGLSCPFCPFCTAGEA